MPFVNTLRSSTSGSFGKKRGGGAALLGNLLAWGLGTRAGIFDTGTLGDGFSVDRSSPVHVGALRTWLKPTSSYYSSMCTKTDGTLWTWGRNNVGQLGLNDTVDRSSPVQIGSLTTWLTPCVGYAHAMCTKTDGTLSIWGRNNYGQLGLNDTTNRSSPVQLGSVTTWSTPTTQGAYTYCNRTDNTLWVWGQNVFGSLGLGDTDANRSSPTQLGNLANWAKPVGNRYGGMAIKTDGTLHFWGRAMSGGMGAALSERSSPVQIGNLTDWASLAIGQNNGFCVKTNGELWVLGGANNYGQCGLNATVPDYRSSPVQIGALTTWLTPASQNYNNNVHGGTMCLRTDGTLWAWGGRNLKGVMGQNNIINRSSPTQIGTKTNWVTPVAGFRSFFCTTT